MDIDRAVPVDPLLSEPLAAFAQADRTDVLKVDMKDHSEEANKALATAADILAQSNDTDAALQVLLHCEGVCRIDGDMWSTLKIVREIARIHIEIIKDDARTVEMVENLSRKRGQHAVVETALVREAFRVITSPPPEARNLELVRRLRTVAASKIHLEAEHARLAVIEADLMHAAGDKVDAFNTLVNLNVETISALPRLEKIDIILHTMERGLEIEQYPEVRTVANKIVEGSIMKDDCVPQRRKYAELLLKHHVHYHDWLSAADAVLLLYRTCGLTDEETLVKAASFLLVAPAEVRDPEAKLFASYSASTKSSNAVQRDMKLLELYEKDKILRDAFGGELHNFVGRMLGSGFIPIDEATKATHGGFEFLLSDPALSSELRARILEHNIKALAEHVTIAPMARAAELVGVPSDELEELLGTLVASGELWCCVDRVDETVRFHPDASAQLEAAQWRADTHAVFDLLDQACHLISRERLRSATGA